MHLSYCSTVQDNIFMTEDPWTHVRSTTKVAMATTINYKQYLILFLDNGGVYQHHFAKICT